MRKYLIISVSLLAFLLFSSKKCESPEDENSAGEEIAFNATVDSIIHSFESDHLSEQTLRAFEVKAIQKLADLADYLQIYSDKSLDESFKDHTWQMILNLFISDSVRVNLKISDEQKEQNLAINELFKTVPGKGKPYIGSTFDSIELSEPLHKINELTYTGSLNFVQNFGLSAGTNSETAGSVQKKIEIIATKVRKQFGSDTLQIWQVYLGDIR